MDKTVSEARRAARGAQAQVVSAGPRVKCCRRGVAFLGPPLKGD